MRLGPLFMVSLAALCLVGHPAASQDPGGHGGSDTPAAADPIVTAIQEASEALSWAQVVACDGRDRTRFRAEHERFLDLVAAYRASNGATYTVNPWIIERGHCNRGAFETQLAIAARSTRRGQRLLWERTRARAAAR